jgi:hypothetical protein
MKKKLTTTAATGDALTATLKPAPRADGKPHRKAPVKSRKTAKPGRSAKPKAKATPAKAKVAPKRTVKHADRDPRLPAIGTTITRHYKDRDLKIRVLADGFELDGKHFSSLSAVARSITKYMVSGFVFFGLADRNVAKTAAEKS